VSHLHTNSYIIQYLEIVDNIFIIIIIIVLHFILHFYYTLDSIIILWLLFVQRSLVASCLNDDAIIIINWVKPK
jgi:hypothetical protein